MAYGSILERLTRYRDWNLADYYSDSVTSKETRMAAYYRAEAYDDAIKVIQETIAGEFVDGSL